MEAMAHHSHPLASELGDGAPLSGEVRARMESAFNANFSNVRVHTSARAAGVAKAHNAFALTAGQDIVFDTGTYLPGHPAGKVLLAHELAHTLQRESQPEPKGLPLPTRHEATVEAEANRHAFGALKTLWHGVRDISSHVARHAGPTVRSGIRLQRCTSSHPPLNPPAFLGPHSRETFDRIKDIIESGDWLNKALVAGPLVTLFTSTPLEVAATGGYPLDVQAEAVAAVPVIVRAQIQREIVRLLTRHGNDLTHEERTYWERIYDQCM